MEDATTRLGARVLGWTPPPRPGPAELEGRYAVVQRLDVAAHADALHRANGADASMWDYMPYGPFPSLSSYRDWAGAAAAGTDPLFYAIVPRATGLPAGVASFLRIAPEAGSIELGHIALAPDLQRSSAATEALYLMMAWAFDAGYRRFEWKCNALNLRSRRAAARLGLSFEGVFRQAAVVKGRNRDTAWFAAIDGEWPALRGAFETWLAPENFDSTGGQIQSLAALTAPIRVRKDPALQP